MNSVEFTQSLLRSDEELLYLTYFGSHLYGTAGPDSDVDYKGLFLPSKRDLLLMKGRKYINWKSGTDNDKNSSEDIDIELWSIHYFIELIGKGDTGAIDLLFSPSNTDTLVYKDSRIDSLFDSPLSLFDPRNTDSYTKYSINQAKKFGCRGSRLGVLKRIRDYISTAYGKDENTMESRLRSIADDILENFYDKSYCFHKYLNGDDALVVTGKIHLYSIKVKEFFNRIDKEYRKYGDRAELARYNRGLDYKALSHSARCIEQTKELLRTGRINYPLSCSPFLKDIKEGKYGWTFLENYIIEGLEEVEKIKEKGVSGNIDKRFIESIIISLYES